jgi:hypothetical protein
MRPSGLFSASCAVLVAAALAGCGNALSLAPANFENREDTVRIYAATATPITRPSGYVIAGRSVVRLDQVSSFDFLFDIDQAGRNILLPLGALIHTTAVNGIPGFLKTPTRFDDIILAEQLGYVTKDTVTTVVGDVFYVRSSIDGTCSLGIPYYAKMEILSVDDSTRSMLFRIVNNINCGYRALGLGLPKK